jgi:hypothetical protein
MADTNPYRDEVLSLLRRAVCHYGDALRDEDAGWTVEQAARERDDVRLDRIIDLRRAVRMVAVERPRAGGWWWCRTYLSLV